MVGGKWGQNKQAKLTCQMVIRAVKKNKGGAKGKQDRERQRGAPHVSTPLRTTS